LAHDLHFRPHVHTLLRRDIENIYRYVARYGLERDGQRIVDRLWQKFKDAPSFQSVSNFALVCYSKYQPTIGIPWWETRIYEPDFYFWNTKEHASMSQQAMHFDEINPDGSASSSAGNQDALHYEEIPRERPSSSAEYEGSAQHHDFFIGSFGQKLSGQDTRHPIILDQRLVLAIVSLLLLMLMSLVGIGLAMVTGAGSPTPAGGEAIFIHGFRHRPDFGQPGFGMGPPPPMVYSSGPVYVHHWTAAPAVLPMFVLVFITFTLAVLAINVLFYRSFQRS